MTTTQIIQAEQDHPRHGIAHFISEQFLNSFLDGQLSLAHFTHFYSKVADQAGRNDLDEGMISIANPSNDRLFFGIEETPGILASTSAMKEMSFNTYKVRANPNTCCHILSCTLISPDKGEYHHKMEEGREYFITFKNFQEFKHRFNKVIIDKGLSAKIDFLEYFDHGRISDPTRCFFAKPLKYAYQKELRLAVFGYSKKARLNLEIGPIRSIVNVFDLRTRKWILH